jgi:type I restriction enzyme S subunit
VAKVDELMLLCDELEAAQNQRDSVRTAARKSAIDAVSTATTPEELDVAWKRISGNWLTIADTSESITSLRSLILDLATLGKLGTQLSSEVVDSTQELKDVDELFPSNWKFVAFSDGCNIEGGNQPPKSKFISEPKSGYVRLYQIRDYGNSPVPTFIPEESTNRFSKQGDVLIGRYGASIGKIFRAADGAYNVALAKFIYPEDLFRSEFVYWILRSSRSQSVFRNMTRSAQAGFNKNDLAALKLPCPPLGEQDRIIGQLSSLMGLCDELEESLLRQNALKKKLSGALTRKIAA